VELESRSEPRQVVACGVSSSGESYARLLSLFSSATFVAGHERTPPRAGKELHANSASTRPPTSVLLVGLGVFAFFIVAATTRSWRTRRHDGD